jgi:DNA modification methylase
MNLTILCGNALEQLRALPDESVQCCVTSPPYFGLRDYGVPGQLGLEKTTEEYVSKTVEIFREVRRVLRSDGTLWLNLGDSYANDGKWAAIPAENTSKRCTALRLAGTNVTPD